MSPTIELPPQRLAESQSDHAELFPLPLTAWEHYMFVDAQCGNSMVFSIQMTFEGVIDRELFEESLAVAISRHPLCRAIVAPGLFRPKWALCPDTQPVLLWLTIGAAFPPEWNRPIDLRYESGLRVCVQELSDGAEVTLQFHHSACDGLGATQFMDDLVAWYGRRKSPEGAGPEAVDANALRFTTHQERQRQRGIHRGARWVREWAAESYRFFGQRPKPLWAPDEGPGPGAQVNSALVSHRFNAADTRLLRNAAQQVGASVNDLLVRDLFASLADWNAQAPGKTRGWYRVNVPVSLRSRDDYHSTATNVVTFGFLNRRHRDCQDKAKLLESLCKELRIIQQTRRGTIILDSLAAFTAVPGVLGLFLKLPMCLSTAVLSNLGDPRLRSKYRFPRRGKETVVGDLVLKSCSGVPPLRAGTHCGVGVNTYASQLTMSVRLTPEYFGPGDADRFLQLYTAHIRDSIRSAE